MEKINWVNITKEDILKAIEKFIEECPDYPEPKSTFLVYEGKKLPAKHIRGMAYEVHYGRKISKKDFGGGKETVKFFERYGFTMSYKENSVNKYINNKEINIFDKTSEVKKKEIVTGVIQNKKVSRIEKHNNKALMNKNKIKITSKQVIEQKNALQLLLNRIFNGDIVCEKHMRG